MRKRFSPPFRQRRDDLDRRVGGLTVTPHESTGNGPDTSRTRYTSRLHRSGRVKARRSTSTGCSRLAQAGRPFSSDALRRLMPLYGVKGQAAIARSPSAPALAAHSRPTLRRPLDDDELPEQHAERPGLDRVLVNGQEVIAEGP